ncbi:hypothetical protein FHR72_002571 [Mycolicibacterium iranicum]|uniref:Uncharacterized protein n=1 Tax=Mycolicibacterium iranicum TaxID=912594 RepID=A0A839Q4C1_MYCIR|nr:hypothetical protein [Mycolicibacterium iranicum]MBB2991098.1 hypothetical protein [Mycolicibacterium iranicum]
MVALRLIAISTFAAAALAFVSLQWGYGLGGVLGGAVVGVIMTTVIPRVIGYIRNERVNLSADHAPLGYVIISSALTAGLTFSAVWFLQCYGFETTSNQSVSLVSAEGRYSMTDVVHDGKQFVAVGWYRKADTDEYLDGAIWTSPDGHSWRRLWNEDIGRLLGGIEIDGGKVAHRVVSAVTRTDNGVVLVGWDTAPDDISRGKAWRMRTDTESLEEAVDLDMPEAGWFDGFAQDGSRQVVVGGVDGTAVAWFRNGADPWIKFSFGPSSKVQIYSVNYEHGRWFAAGTDRSEDPDYDTAHTEEENRWARDGAIWSSADGQHWEKLEGFAEVKGAQKVSDIMYTHGVWLAFGEDDFGDPRQMDAAMWWSDDGIRWQRVSDNSLTGAASWQSMAGAVESPDGAGVLVVGSTIPGKEQETPPAPSGDNEAFAIWANATWQVAFNRANGIRWRAFAETFD